MKKKIKVDLAIEEKEEKPMMVHCSRCKVLFDRKTKHSKLCEHCWSTTKKGPAIGFRGMDSCELCGDIISSEDKRLTLVEQEKINTLSYGKRKCKTIAVYHNSCWNTLIKSKLDAVVKKNKLLTLKNRSLITNEILA